MLMLMLWSVPRSRSTAFYRMMIERGDFTGVHEPFSHVAVFGNVDISGRPLATAPEVIAELRFLASSGFAEVPSRRSPDAEQHPMLGTYLAYHLPFYQKLYQRRLVVLGHFWHDRGRRVGVQTEVAVVYQGMILPLIPIHRAGTPWQPKQP
jgi:hypothetical protein